MSETPGASAPGASASAGQPGPAEKPAPAPSTSPARLERVRVTAPRPGEPIAAPAEHPSIERSDTATVYVRSLIRSQLRLAVICATGFVVSLGMLWLVLAAAPALDQVLLFGAPVSWLLLGFGAYPAILAFAVIFIVASGRNEAGFRSLVSDEPLDRPAA